MKRITTLFKKATHLLSKAHLKRLCLLLIIGFFCDTGFAFQKEDLNDIHVAFAGGGWLAHTGHSAWVMSLLESNKSKCALEKESGNPVCLDQAFKSVKTISSNSGGSWFSTMLIYNSDFVNQITGRNATINWGSTSTKNPNQGWLGKQENYFTKHHFLCSCLEQTFYFDCILALDASISWSNLIEEIVYKGYHLQEKTQLGSGSHQNWASDINLLMGASLLTNSVVLTKNLYFDKLYYQVCPEPYTIKTSQLNGGGHCIKPDGTRSAMPDVLPVTFTSIGQKSNITKKLPLVHYNFTNSSSGASTIKSYTLGYAREFDLSTYRTESFDSQRVKADQISVIKASTASSAAAGFAASYPVLEDTCATAWMCSYLGRKMAPSFAISENTDLLKYRSDRSVDKGTLETLSNKRVLKIAGGGAIDNSAIAQLVSFLQLNDKDDDFTIVSFDNVSAKDTLYDRNYSSSDISRLFNNKDRLSFQSISIRTPNSQIFDSVKRPNIKYTWKINQEDALHYYKYNVTTVTNHNLTVNKGSKGTLHVFASQFKCASIEPQNSDDFVCYNRMIQGFQTILSRKPDVGKTKKTGLQLLQEAFGLNK